MCAASYLRGPPCQGKAGLAPRSCVGFCSPSLWGGTRFRCCFASCSLLRGGGVCRQPRPQELSREDELCEAAGGWLRAGRARCLARRWQGAGRDLAGRGAGRLQAGEFGVKPLAPLNGATVCCHSRPPRLRCSTVSPGEEISPQYCRSCGQDGAGGSQTLRCMWGFALGHAGGPLGLKCLLWALVLKWHEPAPELGLPGPWLHRGVEGHRAQHWQSTVPRFCCCRSC